MSAIVDKLFTMLATKMLCPCGKGWWQVKFKAMGTGCQLCYAAPSRLEAEAFRLAAFHWLAEFEARLSRFIPESLVSALNRRAGGDWVEIDPETEELLALCDRFHLFTGGVFDPTAMPLIKLWDYHAPQPVVPTPAMIEQARQLVGWPKFQRVPGKARLPLPGMGLDLGGIGKEFAVDKLIGIGTAQGIRNLIVDLGHDVRVAGESPDGGAWRIGIENPGNQGQWWGGVAVRDCGVTTSGDYLRNFMVDGKRYGHILDPRTGCPVDNGCQTVTVIAPTCLEAGTLTTAAFILGAADGVALIERWPGAAGCVVTTTGRFDSKGFAGYLS